MTSGATDVTGAGTGVVTFTGATTPWSLPTETSFRPVVESDIWKLSGDTLYFFDQHRGLQVIDVSQPDAPVVRGVLPMAAAGEQMYLLDDSHLVLLALDSCNRQDGTGSQALVVDIRDGKPVVAAPLPIEGTIQESRLVGTALYVASNTYRKAPAENTTAGEQWNGARWSVRLI